MSLLQRVTLARKLIFWGTIIIFVPLSLPVVGIVTVGMISGLLDCGITAAGPGECYVLGLDLGNRLYFYAIPFVGSFLTPMALFMGFWDVLLALLLTWGGLKVYEKRLSTVNKQRQ